MSLTQQQLDQLKADELAVEQAEAKLKLDINALQADGVVVIPPPPPPVPTGGQFKSVVLRTNAELPVGVNPTDSLSPQPLPTGQSWEIEFHGSGGAGPGTSGPYYVNGDKQKAICDQSGGFTHLSGVDVPFLFNVMNSGGRPGISTLPPVLRLQPVDALPLQAPYVNRPAAWTLIETYHHGYSYGATSNPNAGSTATGGTYEPFTERKYLAMLAWARTHYTQVDWTKKGITFGNSMGAWACFNITLRHPELFGAFFASNPRVRHLVTPDYNFGFGSLNPNCPVAGTGKTYAQDRDHVAYVANTANDTPFMGWVIAVNDGFSPFQDHIDMIKACQQTNRPFAIIIHDGIHDSVATTMMNTRLRNTYVNSLFTGAAIPIFKNSSHDGDPSVAATWTDLDLTIPNSPKGKGRSMSINEGFSWTVVTETSTKVVFKVRNSLGDTDVDIIGPHSSVFTGQVAPQRVHIPAGQDVTVTFDSAVVSVPPVIPPAKILSFTASKSSITQGETVTLSWNTQDAVFVLLSNLPNQQLPPSGTLNVTPTVDTTYTLQADDRAANVSDTTSLTVKVTAPVGSVQVEKFPLDLSQLVGLFVQFTPNRYERIERHLCLTQNTTPLVFNKVDLSAGGALRPLLYTTYGWFVDGVCRGQLSVKSGVDTGGTLNVTLINEVDGIHKGQVLPIDTTGKPIAGTECYPPFYFWVDRNGTAKDVPFVIYQNDDFEWTHTLANLPPTYFAWIAPKNVTTPTARPLVGTTAFEAFSSTVPKSDLARIDLVPAMDEGNRFYPCVSDRGITVTENEQGYFTDGYLRDYVYMPQVDGPRGVGTVSHITDMRWGRNNKIYFSSPVSWRVIDAQGTIRTLLGQRHTYAPYYGDISGPGHKSVETIGIWDTSIPVAERFPKKSWFSFFDPATLATDPNALPIGGEQPHLGNPTAYLGDAHGYILKAVFNGQDRSVPPTITRHIMVDKRVFGGALYNNTIYVSEGNLHRISMWDLQSRAYKGDLISDSTASVVGSVNVQTDTFIFAPGQTTATARSHTVVCPEGIAIMDDWLYFGSIAMSQVRRINLITKELQICCDLLASPTSSNVHFANIAVSDGTFGPRHTIFSVHFDNSYFGRPRAWLPGANAAGDRTHYLQWDYAYFGYNQVEGVGYTGTLVGIYPMSVCVGQGGLAFGGTEEAIQVFHKRPSTMAVPTFAQQQQIALGHRKWMEQGLYLPYGRFANGPIPYTKGQDADIDVWLNVNNR
jgi:hypothetical protein